MNDTPIDTKIKEGLKVQAKCIAFATGRTKRLINEYEQIIEEYKKGNYNMKQLLSSEVHIENNIESWIIEYAEKTEQQKN